MYLTGFVNLQNHRPFEIQTDAMAFRAERIAERFEPEVPHLGAVKPGVHDEKHEAGRLPTMYFRRLSHRRWPIDQAVVSFSEQEEKGLTKRRVKSADMRVSIQIGRMYLCACVCSFKQTYLSTLPK